MNKYCVLVNICGRLNYGRFSTQEEQQSFISHYQNNFHLDNNEKVYFIKSYLEGDHHEAFHWCNMWDKYYD